MGNGHSHGPLTRGFGDSAPSSNAGSLSGSRKEKSLSRSASGADIKETTSATTQLVPIEKLTKILLKKAQEEENIQAVTVGTFSRYVFPKYPVLSEKLFHHFRAGSKSKTEHISSSAFKQQCEFFLGNMTDDEKIVNMYVRMYSATNESYIGEVMTPESMRLLLMTAYRIAMDHYSEGPQMCLHIQRTLQAVVDSCFHHKTSLSAQFVSNWLWMNCPRLILPMHRYALHCLTTAYRTLESDLPQLASGLDLATPVLEQPPPFGPTGKQPSHLLPMSAAWLLAGTLAPYYSRPQTAGNSSSTGLSSHSFLIKLISAVPSHWVCLYDSNMHGQGTNRFLHHVLAYRGPTLVVLKADNGSIFVIASPNEWHESHQYWGGEDCAVIQLAPKFLVIERGSKMLYLNTTVRGYPQGLRAGKDPRKPIVIVDKGFEKVEFHNTPYTLSCIEVWGCGDTAQRETQLDIKKWEVKEAERQKNVKLSAADWLDHPDRYLLELAGRPQYNNHNQTQQQQL